MNVFLAWLCALTLFLHSATSNTSGTHPDGCTNIFVTNTLQSVQDNAMSYCQSQGTGGSLAIIKDASTGNFIHDRINSGSPYWIGATYNVNNQWVWNDGTIIGQSGYENWTPGTPSDISSKRCLVIEKSSDGTLSKWYNVACNNAQSLPFICQVAVSAAVLCNPCTHRKQCIVTGCTYKCGSCVKGYYGENCTYLNTTFVESNQQSIKKTNFVNLELSCTFAGFSLPNMTWIFNGTEINTDDVNYDITTTINLALDQIQQTLTIYQPRCVGTTTVTCRAHQNYTNVVERNVSIDPGFQLIQNFDVSTEQCSTTNNTQKTIILEWETDKLIPQNFVKTIVYHLSVRDMNRFMIFQSPIYARQRKFTIDSFLENTTYSIELRAVSETCGKEKQMMTEVFIITPYGIPHQPRDVRFTEHEQSTMCLITWEAPRSPPLDHINSFTMLLITVKTKYRENDLNITENNTTFLNLTNNDTRLNIDGTFNHSVVLKPNRNYYFEIFASSCVGDGLRINATGSCQTDAAAPTSVPQLRLQITSENTIQATIPPINEDNGLISCVFIIVRKNQLKSEKTFVSISDLEKLIDSDETEYISFSDEYDGSEITALLGDGSTSSCNLINYEKGKIEEIKALSKPVMANEIYRIFIVTATQKENSIDFAYSEETTVLLGLVRNNSTKDENGTSNEALYRYIVIALGVGLLISMLLNLTQCILRVSKNKKLQTHNLRSGAGERESPAEQQYTTTNFGGGEYASMNDLDIVQPHSSQFPAKQITYENFNADN